jgi:hypothetical protein
MALDDVVIRAMSKSPDDRYPSAGDLGRAAQAALRGEAPVVPERTVATGAAATRTAETISTKAGETQASPPPTESTRRLADDSSASSRSASESNRRRWALAGGVAALVAALVVVIVLISGGGGSTPESSGQTDANATTPTTAKTTPAPKPEPKTLTRSELINKADAICEDSQDVYKSVRSQAMEESPDVGYAATLVGISERALRRLRALDPPPNLADDFKGYVEAQRLVALNDRQALAAAEGNDNENYVAARERRDSEADERYRAARQVGLQVCSASRG